MSESGFIRIRVLGCGSSGGVPRIDGDWGDCNPKNKKNRRLRCSLLVERGRSPDAFKTGELTRLLIDTSPDMREQLLAAGIKDVDAVTYTHIHADQTHGIDDLRAIIYKRGERLKAYMDRETWDIMSVRFDYIFQTPDGSLYPPLMDARVLDLPSDFEINRAGGPIKVSAFPVQHGRLRISGFRFGSVAYTPDVSDLTDGARDVLQDTPLWVVDALREKPHPTHAHLELSLSWISQLSIRSAILTNLHIDLDYDALNRKCPSSL